MCLFSLGFNLFYLRFDSRQVCVSSVWRLLNFPSVHMGTFQRTGGLLSCCFFFLDLFSILFCACYRYIYVRALTGVPDSLSLFFLRLIFLLVIFPTVSSLRVHQTCSSFLLPIQTILLSPSAKFLNFNCIFNPRVSIFSSLW